MKLSQSLAELNHNRYKIFNAPFDLNNAKQAIYAFQGDTYVGFNAATLNEKENLIQALRQCGGNQSKAARLLGINRVTVWNRIKKYGIDLKGI